MNGSVGSCAREGLEPRAADKGDACSCYEQCWTVAYCTFAIYIRLLVDDRSKVAAVFLASNCFRLLLLLAQNSPWRWRFWMGKDGKILDQFTVGLDCPDWMVPAPGLARLSPDG
jgi:hypothetical protein